MNYTLFELNEFIRQVIALNFQEAIWVKCEIAQINESRGHYYLNLVQKSQEKETIIAQSSAVIWARKYWQLKKKLGQNLPALLQLGTEVLLKVKVEFDERYGLKLLIEDLDPSYTIGQMELRRQAILENLIKQDLLHLNSKIPFPLVLQRIAVLSSPTAAGLQDYLNHLATNPYGYHFENRLFPTAMQGDRVEIEMLASLELIRLSKDKFDLVVIIRGGGSKLDLAAFDSFELGKAIAQFPLPVITGIGHEIDETIIDKVAHTALKTPTAVADFLINRMLHFEAAIIEYRNYIHQATKQQVKEKQTHLTYLQKIVQLQTESHLKVNHQAIEQLKKRLPLSVKNLLTNENNRIRQLDKFCQILSPETALKRGFTLTSVNGKTINSSKSAELKEGVLLETQFLDGVLKSKIIK